MNDDGKEPAMGVMSQLNVDALELDEALAEVHEKFSIALGEEFGTNPATTEEEFEARIAPHNEARLDRQVEALREAGWIPPTIVDVILRKLRPLEKRMVGQDARQLLLEAIGLLGS